MMPPFVSLLGRRFGRLVVIERGPSKGLRTRWRCQCDCGTECLVGVTDLLHQHTRSCGCRRREVSRASMQGPQAHWKSVVTHGMSKTREYRAWQGAKKRCAASPKAKCYPLYAGRGIHVAPEWTNDFGAFLAHIGPCPPGLTLDRIDTNGHYEPGNVRWATPEEQANNLRSNRVVMIDGDIPMSVAQIARAMEISWKTAKRMYGHLLVRETSSRSVPQRRRFVPLVS
jgi:hypothetical protein